MQNKTLKRKLNLVPQNLLIYEMLKIVQWVVIGLCIAGVILMTVIAVKGYMEIDRLDKELAEDKQIIAEGHLDELNALKEQYDNLILGIDSGNITLIPDIDIKMTELFTVITQHKPSAAQLTGVEGQLKIPANIPTEWNMHPPTGRSSVASLRSFREKNWNTSISPQLPRR